jgi:aryl-alcohol dehydrogenase-like predicted oxidoreductase
MNFGEDTQTGCGVEESEAIMQSYIERGGNFVDTANFYTNTHSEKIVGDFIAARPGLRDRIVLATKFFVNLHPGDPNGGGAGRKAVLRQLHDSLRRLNTDYIDLYWLHNYDAHTPLDELLRTLDDLVSAGTIRYLGFSDTPAWYTAQAHTIATLRGWSPVVALQMEYSLLSRTIEGEIVPLAQDTGMAILPWGPLKSGFLSGKYTRAQPVPAGTKRAAAFGIQPTGEQFDVIEVVTELARQLGATPAAVALAWVHGRPGVTSTLIGPRRVDQLVSNLDALDLELSADQRGALDAISLPQLNFPATLNRDVAPMLQYAGATVNALQTSIYPPLLQSSTRY